MYSLPKLVDCMSCEKKSSCCTGFKNPYDIIVHEEEASIFCRQFLQKTNGDWYHCEISARCPHFTGSGDCLLHEHRPRWCQILPLVCDGTEVGILEKCWQQQLDFTIADLLPYVHTILENSQYIQGMKKIWERTPVVKLGSVSEVLRTSIVYQNQELVDEQRP